LKEEAERGRNSNKMHVWDLVKMIYVIKFIKLPKMCQDGMSKSHMYKKIGLVR